MKVKKSCQREKGLHCWQNCFVFYFWGRKFVWLFVYLCHVCWVEWGESGQVFPTDNLPLIFQTGSCWLMMMVLRTNNYPWYLKRVLVLPTSSSFCSWSKKKRANCKHLLKLQYSWSLFWKKWELSTAIGINSHQAKSGLMAMSLYKTSGVFVSLDVLLPVFVFLLCLCFLVLSFVFLLFSSTAALAGFA